MYKNISRSHLNIFPQRDFGKCLLMRSTLSSDRKKGLNYLRRENPFRIQPKLPKQVMSFYKVMGLSPSSYLDNKEKKSQLNLSPPSEFVRNGRNESYKAFDNHCGGFISVLLRINDDPEEDNGREVKNAEVTLSHWKTGEKPMIKLNDHGSTKKIFKYFRRLIPPQSSQQISFQTIVSPQMIENFFSWFSHEYNVLWQ